LTGVVEVGTVNVEFEVRPTSLDSAALNVKGNLVCDNATEVEMDFGWWVVSSSKFPETPITAQIAGNNLRILTERSRGETEFELMLSPTPEMSKRFQVSKGKNFVWKIVGSFYPFIARKLELPITIKSSGSKINLNVNLVLSNNMIPYGGGGSGFSSQSSHEDGKLRMFSGAASGENKVTKSFRSIIRFTPFFAFREALYPVVLIYTAALITQVLRRITTLSLQWEFLSVSIEPSIAFSLLQMIVNVYLFIRISKIKVGIVGTRCLLTALKVAAWAFMGLLILNATYPSSLAILGFNVFDLILKSAQIWIITIIFVSLFVYPYIADEAKRTHLMSIMMVIALISSVCVTALLPPLHTALDLLSVD